MTPSLVSVVIPVLDGERFLAETLESVFAQDYPRFEVIVVDDGSTDGTADVARSFGAVRYIHQSNQGQAVARNTGIAAARGEFLAFLDADDLWTPNKLSLQVGYLLTHPEIGFTLSRQRIFLEPGAERPSWLRDDLIDREHVGFFPSTLVVRRSVFDRIGVYDPSFRIGESADWFARANDAGIRRAIVPEVLLHKRVHGVNLTNNHELARADIFRALRSSIARRRADDQVVELGNDEG